MVKKILLVDCFDSFTYNLKHYLDQFCETDVIRVDQISLENIDDYDALVLSPGPKLPKDYPVLNKIINRFYKTKPILGVCLGMQALGEYFGGEIKHLLKVKHGLSEPLDRVDFANLFFASLKDPIFVARYHSWVVQPTERLNKHFKYTSFDNCGEIMSFVHNQYPIYGVQFHPESIMTPYGLLMIENWVMSLN